MVASILLRRADQEKVWLRDSQGVTPRVDEDLVAGFLRSSSRRVSESLQ